MQKGRLLGAQLGWPRQWLGGSKRRLFFLVDLRQPPGCAMFVLEDRTRTRAQLFWLREVKVLFGRREFRFVCPTDGVLARTLAYSRGQFKPAPGEPPIAAPDNLSTPEPAREVDLSGLPALVQEIVALWTGLAYGLHGGRWGSFAWAARGVAFGDQTHNGNRGGPIRLFSRAFPFRVAAREHYNCNNRYRPDDVGSKKHQRRQSSRPVPARNQAHARHRTAHHHVRG